MSKQSLLTATAAVFTIASLVGCSAPAASGQQVQNVAATPPATKASMVESYLAGSWKCPKAYTNTLIGFTTMSPSGSGRRSIASGSPSTLTFTPGRLNVEVDKGPDTNFTVTTDDRYVIFTGLGGNSEIPKIQNQQVKIPFPDKVDGMVSLSARSDGGNGEVAFTFAKDSITVHDAVEPTSPAKDLVCTRVAK